MANTSDTVFQKVCFDVPTKINSPGLMRQFQSNNRDYIWLDYTLPRIMLLIVTMFVISQASHFVLKRLGLPIFISQIIAGLMLSRPALQGIKLADKVITRQNVQLLGALGDFGYAFFMFLSGVKMDPSMVKRVGRKAWFIGIFGVVMPAIWGLSIIGWFNNHKEIPDTMSFSLLPMYFTSTFPVINCLLTELKILNSELGRLAQSSAMVADILSLSSFIFIALMKVAAQSLQSMLIKLGVIVIFLLVVFCLLRPAMLLIVRLTPEGGQVSQIGMYSVVLVFLVLTRIIPQWNTLFTLVGLYIFGLAVPQGPPLGSALVNKFDCLVSGLLLPIFVTNSAMKVEHFSINFGKRLIWHNAMIAFATILIKFIACFLPLMHWNMRINDATALALIMNSKGIVELAIYTFASDGKLVTPTLYNFMLTTLIVMASIVPVLVRKLYDPSRKYAGYYIRKIIDVKHNEELQIVACIHTPNNISSAINLFSILCPVRERPIAVNALHLIKLNGQATPIFVSHQKKIKNSSTYRYSENVILSFKKFEAINWGGVIANSFTAISPPEFMLDDICTLALDNHASLVIVPFHRSWYIDGSLEFEDLTIRSLNCRILEKAPCSIGILIDHGNVRRPTTHLYSPSEIFFNVVMFFLGGNDDREALAFAKRMAQDSRVRLTVAHFIAESDEGKSNWETILNSEILRDAKWSESIRYVRYVVKDGPETVKIIHSMVNDCNLIIVGRRYNLEDPQTSCLKEWTEFPELGILGDILASKDLDTKCSVLIIQQQLKC